MLCCVGGRRCGPCARGAEVRAQRRRARARAVRGPVACSARRGRPHRPHRSVEQEPAMPGPRILRAAWQHGPPHRHHHTQPRSDHGTVTHRDSAAPVIVLPTIRSADPKSIQGRPSWLARWRRASLLRRGSPPAPRRPLLLFLAVPVRVYKIIIGRRRWRAGPYGAEPSLTSAEPRLAPSRDPGFPDLSPPLSTALPLYDTNTSGSDLTTKPPRFRELV